MYYKSELTLSTLFRLDHGLYVALHSYTRAFLTDAKQELKEN